jgi:hypothetical protein
MAGSRRWSADDVAKLRQLAGIHPRNAIAAGLGRAPSALAVNKGPSAESVVAGS